MFEKKDIIFSETMGVCRVAEIAKLPAKNNEQVLYYGLKGIYDDKKVSYIPVEHHQVLLRELITIEEAKELSAKRDLLTPQQLEEVEYVMARDK